MASDSHHFRFATDLEADGYVLEGNVFKSPYDQYLPLYEAKMLHQFDHRWATYHSATESSEVTTQEKESPFFVALPRYWIREEVVQSALPKYPESLALSLKLQDDRSVERILRWWAAAYYRQLGHSDTSDQLLNIDFTDSVDSSIDRLLGEGTADEIGARLQADFPLTEDDEADTILSGNNLIELANKLVEKFSPKWLLGWRDICRSTDTRTMIASALPCVPIGHTFPLLLPRAATDRERLFLIAMLNSFVLDYACRQKVGGTHITYGLLKQFPVLGPPASDSLTDHVVSLTKKLVFSAEDMRHDNEEVHVWDEELRFDVRCELDAIFLHLYLQANSDGAWQRMDSESDAEFSELRMHFAAPRDAASYILDQFPIVERDDKDKFNEPRTKNRILEHYDRIHRSSK